MSGETPAARGHLQRKTEVKYVRVLPPHVLLPGEHIGKVTPVPIPNTAVKLSEPMIVPKRVKVGIAGI